MWSAWSGIESVLVAPWNCMRLMIWCGCIEPWSVSSRRIVMSVIEPGPWWPAIGMPLMAAMSTALPLECSEMLPEVVIRLWPHSSALTVGLSPEAARNSSVASTRRSIAPARMSRWPQE